MHEQLPICVIGSGPAGLMAADALAQCGQHVVLLEQRPAPGWKLYIAGSSGLNITNRLPLDAFGQHYTGPRTLWSEMLAAFGPQEWIRFIEQDLGLSTFCGTSGRYFVSTMHAAGLVRAWRKRLEVMGVAIHTGARWRSLTASGDCWRLRFDQKPELLASAVVLAVGGGSYVKDAGDLCWPDILQGLGLEVRSFAASNAGYEVAWPPAFVQEADGLPLKNIELQTARGRRKGDLVITSYGLEGTPIYFFGQAGPAFLDLKVDLTRERIQQKLERHRENLSPLRRASRLLNLSPAAKALLFHMSPPAALDTCEALAATLKAFPLELLRPRPLLESISSQGGLDWEELDHGLMLKKLPGVFAAGEMIDWDAPTGGFLIQACVSQGRWVAEHLLRYLTLRR